MSVPAHGQQRLSLATEIDAALETQVDERLTRRLIVLEIAEIEIPPPVGRNEGGALFFRVLADGDAIRLELWERGELHGARRVSSGGGPRLISRRVAAAAAHLAARLRYKRLLQAREAAIAAQVDEELPPPGVPLYARLTLAAEARAFALPGQAWAAGPRLRTDLRFDQGSGIGIGVGYAAGRVTALKDVGWRWLEVALRGSHRFGPPGGIGWVPGVEIGLASMHLAGAEAVAGLPGEHQAWSARAGLDLTAEVPMAKNLWFTAAPEAGVVLRRTRVVDSRGQQERLGGLWLGIRLGLLFDEVAAANSEEAR